MYRFAYIFIHVYACMRTYIRIFIYVCRFISVCTHVHVFYFQNRFFNILFIFFLFFSFFKITECMLLFIYKGDSLVLAPFSIKL